MKVMVINLNIIKIYYTYNRFYKMFCNCLSSSNKSRHRFYCRIFLLSPTHDNCYIRLDILVKAAKNDSYYSIDAASFVIPNQYLA